MGYLWASLVCRACACGSWTLGFVLLLCCIDLLVVNSRHSAACLLFCAGSPHGRHSRPAFCASSSKPPSYFSWSSSEGASGANWLLFQVGGHIHFSESLLLCVKMLWPMCLFICELCSDDNLCKDPFLRQHMDDQGWVPLSLIAGFRKVSFQVLWVDFLVKSTLNS